MESTRNKTAGEQNADYFISRYRNDFDPKKYRYNHGVAVGYIDYRIPTEYIKPYQPRIYNSITSPEINNLGNTPRYIDVITDKLFYQLTGYLGEESKGRFGDVFCNMIEKIFASYKLRPPRLYSNLEQALNGYLAFIPRGMNLSEKEIQEGIENSFTNDCKIAPFFFSQEQSRAFDDYIEQNKDNVPPHKKLSAKDRELVKKRAKQIVEENKKNSSELMAELYELIENQAQKKVKQILSQQ